MIYEAPYHPSGTRPQLLDGCDRPVYVLITTLCVLVPLVWMSVWALMVCVLIYFTARYWLRKLGKHDPLAIKIYMQQLGYRAYYAARSYYHHRPRSTEKKWI